MLGWSRTAFSQFGRGASSAQPRTVGVGSVNIPHICEEAHRRDAAYASDDIEDIGPRIYMVSSPHGTMGTNTL
jgi:hypothetical protein